MALHNRELHARNDEPVSQCNTPPIHLTILISAQTKDSSLSFLTGHILLPYNIRVLTQLLYIFPRMCTQVSLAVRNTASCLNLFQPLNTRNRDTAVPAEGNGDL